MKIVNLMKIVNCYWHVKLKINKGFTLIELLVVIGIVGLLVAMSTAAMVSGKQKRQTKVVAEQVKNVIMEAHAYAASPKYDLANPSTGDIDIYVTDHKVEAKIDDVVIAKSNNLTSNVTLSCVPTTSSFCFSFETGDTTNIGKKAPDNRYIKATNDAGEIYNIKVGELSGNVTVEAN